MFRQHMVLFRLFCETDDHFFRRFQLEKAIQIVHTEDKAAADEMRLLNAIVTGYKEYVIQLEQSCERVLAVAPDIDRLQLLLSGKPRRRVVVSFSFFCRLSPVFLFSDNRKSSAACCCPFADCPR